jgi:hypothetical protein
MDAAPLKQIVESTPWLMALLQVVRDAGPAHAYIAAGAIRDTVWAHLTGRPLSEPWADVDVVYFEPREQEGDSRHHESRLRLRAPAVRWEVTNQAWVHMWKQTGGARTHRPHSSVLEGLQTWPETATAVGVRLGNAGELFVIAPFGLGDLFDLVVRYNPLRASIAVYEERIAAKCWAQRWPELRIVPGRAG